MNKHCLLKTFKILIVLTIIAVLMLIIGLLFHVVSLSITAVIFLFLDFLFFIPICLAYLYEYNKKLSIYPEVHLKLESWRDSTDDYRIKQYKYVGGHFSNPFHNGPYYCYHETVYMFDNNILKNENEINNLIELELSELTTPNLITNLGVNNFSDFFNLFMRKQTNFQAYVDWGDYRYFFTENYVSVFKYYELYTTIGPYLTLTRNFSSYDEIGRVICKKGPISSIYTMFLICKMIKENRKCCYFSDIQPVKGSQVTMIYSIGHCISIKNFLLNCSDLISFKILQKPAGKLIFL